MNKVLFVAALAVLLTACQAVSDVKQDVKDDVKDAARSLDKGETEWQCVQYTCSSYGTGIDWAEANCEERDNGTVCPVSQGGRTYYIPVSQINLTAITQSQSYCEEYRCVQEAPVRSVNYTVNRSDVPSQRRTRALQGR